MSRNLRIFAFAAVVFATVGLMNDATVMYVLAGVCAAVILVAFLLAHLSLSRVRVQMHPPAGSSVAGSELRSRLSVESSGSITVSSAAVELAAVNLTVEGVEARRTVLLPPLPPGSGADIEVALRPPTRGRYRLGPPTVIDSDPLGMFDGRAEQGEAVEVIVFPRTYDVPRVAAWETGFGRYSARGREARRDRGEFRGIREHTSGDDLRHVHWKVTAHVGELAVKEYEPLRHDVISIHLDLSADNHYGEGATGTLETTVSAAASLARGGLAEQRSVAVMGANLPPGVARPGSGQAHMHRIMVSLAEARPAQGRFTEGLVSQLRLVPRGASVFVITTAAEEGLVQALSGAISGPGSVILLVVEGHLEQADERFAVFPRRAIESARASGIGVGLLRSPADIADALTVATGPSIRTGAVIGS
ncbi:MAG: DUF58 domain-containing protein [Armatimonadota bacterium]|jgi:uncharacterized protein (DUF58 family)